MAQWGQALRWRAESAARAAPASNGQHAARRYGLRSAGEEAALGFPTLFETTLPALQAALQVGHALPAARVQAFFATMAVLDDTNTAHRGGLEGVQFVKASAHGFLAAGGVAQSRWLQQARALHAEFVVRRLSPGGAADVLAAACWLQEMRQAADASQHLSDRQSLAQSRPGLLQALATHKASRRARKPAHAKRDASALLAAAWAA
jgi:triphosphoribosyl-dephospho-CoA synthase